MGVKRREWMVRGLSGLWEGSLSRDSYAISYLSTVS